MSIYCLARPCNCLSPGGRTGPPLTSSLLWNYINVCKNRRNAPPVFVYADHNLILYTFVLSSGNRTMNSTGCFSSLMNSLTSGFVHWMTQVYEYPTDDP